MTKLLFCTLNSCLTRVVFNQQIWSERLFSFFFAQLFFLQDSWETQKNLCKYTWYVYLCYALQEIYRELYSIIYLSLVVFLKENIIIFIHLKFQGVLSFLLLIYYPSNIIIFILHPYWVLNNNSHFFLLQIIVTHEHQPSN